MPTLNVHFLPALTSPEALSGSTVVVIDVLRATTTIAAALGAGAREVIPCLEVDEARRVASELPPGSFLLGGERGGKRIDGFDLGNSPAEYTSARVAGMTVVFTTTNGTRALRTCIQAESVWLGALANLGAVVQAIAEHEDIVLLCAGTDDEISHEDVLAAGMMVRQLTVAGRKSRRRRKLGDGATIAEGFAVSCGRTELQRRKRLASSRGGQNLVSLGFLQDIRDAAQVDTINVAPKLDLSSWRILPG